MLQFFIAVVLNSATRFSPYHLLVKGNMVYFLLVS